MPSELAVEGGRPVRSEMLSYGHQVIDAEDERAVVEALHSQYLTTGPRVEEFESAFAYRVGARYAVAVSSGTAALHAAAFAVGVGPGVEAVVPAMTFAASANCIRYCGGDVAFADVAPGTLIAGVDQFAPVVGPATKVLVAVDYAGQPADLDEITTFARESGLTVIEDAAHALGASRRERPVGSISDVTIFSMHPVKQITSGEGGVLTTDSPALASRARRFRNHGITMDQRERGAAGSWWYEIEELGFNYRLTDFQCALAGSQLLHLDAWIERRGQIAATYAAALGSLPEVSPLDVLPQRAHAWHLYVISLRLERLRVGRKAIFEALRAENIGVNVHYIPVPWHPYYQGLGFRRGGWPVSEAAYESILSLPMWAGMSDRDVADVCQAMDKVISAYRR